MDAPQSIFMAVLWLIGGLALFLYGIEMMSQALRRAAGKAMRTAFKRLTRTRIHGLLTGALVTALLQSSSATTVMVVGFISSGLLAFPQSVGLILGANVGTTVTPQITAFASRFKIEAVALPLLGIGFLINFLGRKRVLREAGLVCMGFGMLFFGLALMKLAVGQYHDEIRVWLAAYATGGLRDRALAFVVAMIGTAILQSSAATIVIVQALAFDGALTDLGIAICFVLGAHVGTCVTALLASMRSSLSARRAAVAHLLFNLMGVLLTLALFPLYMRVIPRTAPGLGLQIANAHLAIKLINALLFLPLTTVFARMVEKITPGEDTLNATPAFLDYDALARPAAAMDLASREIRRICEICLEMLEDSVHAFFERDEMRQELVLKREALVDDLYRTVAHYLADIARHGPPAHLLSRPPLLLHIMNDAERIGDHAENIVEISQAYTEKESRFSDAARAEIDRLLELTMALGRTALKQLDAPSDERGADVLRLKRKINARVDQFLDAHDRRLQNGRCSVIAGIVYVDLLMNLRRVTNHLRNIAMSAGTDMPEHTLQVQQLARELERDLESDD